MFHIFFIWEILFNIVLPWTTLKRKIPPLGGEDFGCGLQGYGILYSDKWLSVFFRRTFSLHFRVEPVKCCVWSSVSSGNYWMSLHCCKLGQNFLTFCSFHAVNETHLVFGVVCSSFWYNFTSFDSNTLFLVPQ